MLISISIKITLNNAQVVFLFILETVKKVINLVKLDAEKNNESIYETARYDLDDDDNYHSKI
jgi:cell division septal protein FtsQ